MSNDLETGTKLAQKDASEANGNQRNNSQTASEYINSQLQLEAEAREALPYSFDHCTRPLGALKQNIYSCLTCNPPPKDLSEPYNAAGICYGCSIACHGEHTLVELFAHRNFTCDCGTTRLPVESPCTLRINSATGVKGAVHSEEPSSENTYNRNFRNYFCGCGELYDAHKQKGTMYQCIGLSTEQEGGCGEDWWHPECLKGWRRDWYLSEDAQKLKVAKTDADEGEEDDHPVVPGFREDFASLICYKCVDANPWIKKYAASDGFMVISHSPQSGDLEAKHAPIKSEPTSASIPESSSSTVQNGVPELNRKRKVDDDHSETESTTSKRAKIDTKPNNGSKVLHAALPKPPTGSISLIALEEDFRNHFCRCPECYPALSKFPQLLEEEDTYQPPESEDEEADGPGSIGTKSLLERGEAALSNVDRVRAIEGVMAYNHLRDKVKNFLKPFAESGEAVSAEHIKAYFEKLRGDDEAMRDASLTAGSRADGNVDKDHRREESSK